MHVSDKKHCIYLLFSDGLIEYTEWLYCRAEFSQTHLTANPGLSPEGAILN